MQLAVVFLILFALPFSSAAREPIKVTAGIAPAQFLVERIGGENVSAQALVRSGQSPHTFEPSPRQITDLANSRLFLNVGIPFEKELAKRIASGFPNVQVVDLRKNLRLIQMTEQDEHDHGGDIDPHTWLDPRNMIIMARTIAETLSSIDPENAANYQENLSQLTKEIEALDQELQSKLKPYAGRTFYVFHPAFGYFADRYNLKQKAVELGGKEPSARHLAAVIDQAKADNVRVIIAQPQFSTQAAQALAKAISGAVVKVDNLEKDYPKMMRLLGDAVSKALSNGASR